MAMQSSHDATGYLRKLNNMSLVDSQGDGLFRPRPLSILVIDDSDDDYMHAYRLLRHMDTFDATIDHARDVTEAKNLKKIRNFEVVIVDFCLGLETGASAIHELGGRVASAATILLSGMPGQQIPQIALRAGAILCLDKNRLTAAILETAIRSALHTHALERRLDEAISDLQFANRSAANLSARIGDDLREPLNSIIVNADTITRQNLGPFANAKISNSVEHITAGGIHLLKSVDDFLQHAARRAIVSPLRGTIDLKALLQSAQLSIGSKMRALDQRLELSLPEEGAQIVGSALVLTEALTSLLFDSVKHTPTGGTVFLDLSANAGRWVLRLVDGGIARADADVNVDDVSADFTASRSKLTFDPATDGISLVDDIVKSHNGEINREYRSGVAGSVSISFPIPPVEESSPFVPEIVDGNSSLRGIK